MYKMLQLKISSLCSQGPYSSEGDIVVLCAYLGQLAHVRDALSDKVAVVIDERDQQQLAVNEDEREDINGNAPSIEHVEVSHRVGRLSDILPS